MTSSPICSTAAIFRAEDAAKVIAMGKTVLIIDDSVSLHKLISTYLAPDNLQVHCAHDGESGIAAAESLQPDLILLDVDMPRLDGFEVCRRLKADSVTSTIPVMFLTASSMLDCKVRGLEIGASDYMSKPFNPAELRARVRALLRAKNQIEAVKLVDGPTGLWNRVYLNSHLDYHISLARRLGIALSCVVVEVDHGDASAEGKGAPIDSDLLRAVGRILSGGCRAEDVVCRIDVRKFAILVIGINSAAAVLVADRLRGEINRQMRPRNDISGQLTCGFGIADSLFGEAATIVDRAESAIADAHSAGAKSDFVAGKAFGVTAARSSGRRRTDSQEIQMRDLP